VTVMVTDCLQGIFVGVAVLIFAFFLLDKFSFDTLEQAMALAPADASMIHPYHTSKVKDFNAWFYLIAMFGMFYGYMSWQGSQAYQSSGLNPHEQKMGAIIGLWRQLPTRALVVLIAVCSFALMKLPQFAAEQMQVHAVLDTIDNDAIRTQMTVPLAFSVMLPIGLKGLFVTTMIFWEITTLDTYMHSWGSIFIQDVVLPFRKRPFTPRQHVRLLRLSILFVGVFSFVFSLLFRQTEYIFMFFAITGAIISGAGAAIVGGLYWNRGTAGAAWTAMTIGWVLAVGRIVLSQLAPVFADVAAADRGPLLLAMDWINSINSQVIWFWIMVSCLASYVGVSLLVPHKAHDMDKMLHRGKYRVATDHVELAIEKRTWYQKITGVDREFTFWDRVLANLLVFWNFGWFAVFLGGTIYNYFVDVPDHAWMRFWQVWIWLQMGIGAPVTVWFTWGSIRDTLRLFKRLDSLIRDENDDGRVKDEAPGHAPGSDVITQR
jgi:SSS family solute:Na+ symporter